MILYLFTIMAQQALVRRILTSLVHRAAIAQECRLTKQLPIPPRQMLWLRYYGTPSDTDSTDSKQTGNSVTSAATSTDNRTGSALPGGDNEISGIPPMRCADERSGSMPAGVDDGIAPTRCANELSGVGSIPTNTVDIMAKGAHSTSIHDADAVNDDDPEGFSEGAEGSFDDNMDDTGYEQKKHLVSEPRDTSNDDLESIFDEEDLSLLNAYEKDWDPRDILVVRKKEMSGRNRIGTYLEELEQLPILHVLCTFNNTYINICDHTGRILTWKSAGSLGYKNCRRGTSFAAQSVGQAAAQKARELGIKKVRVKLKGLGVGRQHSLKGFELGGLQIMSIQDVTPIPHNGCRPKKKRRV